MMIACISPCNTNFDETINTLKYASRARHIKRNVNKNIKRVKHVSGYIKVIKTLKEEI